jgi:hypothetical protein
LVKIDLELSNFSHSAILGAKKKVNEPRNGNNGSGVGGNNEVMQGK